MNIVTNTQSNDELDHPVHHWKVYVALVISILGIALLTGYFYLSSIQLKENLSQTNEPIPSPSNTIPRLQQAEKELKELEVQSIAEPANAKVLRDQARNYIFLDDYKSALEKLQQELTVNANDPTLHYELGNIYLKLDEVDHAIESFQTSIDLDSIDNNSYIDLANIYIQEIPDRARVISVYSEATNNNPKNITFRILFASFYEQINEEELALQQYQDILTIDPTNDTALRKVAQLTQ